MAAGRTHARAAAVTALALSAYATQIPEPAHALAFAAGAWAGWLIDPDLDHEQLRTHTERRIYRWLGTWPGRVWQAIWAPYGVLIPHRSPLSHLPGLGTAIRAGYLFAVAWTIGHAIGHPPPLPSPEIIRWTLGAWAVQDTVHLWLDGWRLRWGS